MEPIKVALLGNPNTGKSSLLNSLAGLQLHVGNWPGKTVEKKEGVIQYRGREISIVDLPGAYSIKPYSEEERVSNGFITSENPDVIVQVVDVNALQRNLLMTYELIARNKKVVLAFNFNREAKERGLKVNIKKISSVLKLPIVPVEADRGENNNSLLKEIITLSQKKYVRPACINRLIISKNNIDRKKALTFFSKKLSPFYKKSSVEQKIPSIDRVIMNKYLAFPIFILVMYGIFNIIFSLSRPLIHLIEAFFGIISELLQLIPMPVLLHSFVTNGVINGVGTVVSFTPLIFLLFAMIALLEDSGYLGRIVVLTDRLFQKFGITGRSFIPMILGFGCNVPAILCTRIIKNRKERLIGILTNSFISCGARLPVYVLFAGIFFPQSAALVIIGLYLFGILVNLTASLVLSKLVKNHEPDSLIIELPPYRRPVFTNIIRHAWYHTKEFLKRAGTLIFLAVIVVWFLASFPLGGEYASQTSLLGIIGRTITPLFSLNGFGHWTFVVSLIFGVLAKEVIIGTLGTIQGVSAENLAAVFPHYVNQAGALSFMVFVLLYTPCVASIAAMRKETGKWSYAVAQSFVTVIIAWIASFIVFQTVLLIAK